MKLKNNQNNETSNVNEIVERKSMTLLYENLIE